MKAIAAIMLTVVVVCAACTKDPENGGNNDGGSHTERFTISVAVNPTDGGVVSGGGTFNSGASCTVTATANEGYTFTKWTENGNTVSTNASYTFTVSANKVMVAHFTVNTPNQYMINVSANPTEGGTIIGGGTYQQGQSCTVSATAATGFNFQKWTENGSLVSTNSSYTFTVANSRTLVANFAADATEQYTVSVSSNPSSGGTVSGGGTYNEGVSLILRANANTNYIFDHWQDGNTTNPRTVTVTSNVTYTAYFTYNGGGSGNANGHAYVDLGLPSGLLWATCNVGASIPAGFGNYYAWGETTTKSTYNWDYYIYCMASNTALTKYCDDSSCGFNGFTDNLTTLQPIDDAATVNWGGDWRMPTKEEWKELRNNTIVTWTSQNGVRGCKFTASNGNSLFLPATGYRVDDVPYYVGIRGYYWSSSLTPDNAMCAEALAFRSGNNFIDYNGRCTGQPVRAVLPASKN